MRRIVTWALSTITVVVLLFSYRTSTSSIVGATSQVTSKAGPGAGAGNGKIGDPTPTPAPRPTPTPAPAPAPTSTPARPGANPGSGQAPTQGIPGNPGSQGSAGTAYVGDPIGTRYGNVQVQILVANGKITSASVLQVPNRDRKDVQINNRAVPILNQQVVSAQSADIDMVSGATVTSMAYIQSLQSALDQAHL